ncbi:MAG: hypothetical protein COB90_05000 [Hyphomicrobiales bacterium]|nr:MAG: hypothetical protein COB90_05000 [Hyphomicrobiales bacterium]
MIGLVLQQLLKSRFQPFFVVRLSNPQLAGSEQCVRDFLRAPNWLFLHWPQLIQCVTGRKIRDQLFAMHQLQKVGAQPGVVHKMLPGIGQELYHFLACKRRALAICPGYAE